MPAIFKIYPKGVYAHRETFFDKKQLTWVKTLQNQHIIREMKGQARHTFKSNEFVLKKLRKDDWVYNDKQTKKRSQGDTSLT